MQIARKFLHVDDDPMITTFIAKYLAKYGYQGIAIHDPTKVVHELPRVHERVVLLDIDMPGLNGLELLQQIKAFDAGIQVIMLSGLATMTTVLQSQRLGAEACFFKPIHDIAPLVDALDACFRKIERWWATLDDLSQRRKAESCERNAVAVVDETTFEPVRA